MTRPFSLSRFNAIKMNRLLLVWTTREYSCPELGSQTSSFPHIRISKLSSSVKRFGNRTDVRSAAAGAFDQITLRESI